MGRIRSRLMHAWSIFDDEQASNNYAPAYGPQVTAYESSSPSRMRSYVSSERSIIASIYTRLSIDVASVDLRHVRLDDQKRYSEDIDSGLNNCLTVEANRDQGARHFRQNIAAALFAYGVVAIVPVDFTANPGDTGGWDIKTARVGRIVKWFPKHVTVDLYNERRGMCQEITLPKSQVAIIENPLYDVMNEPNSTLQRLIRKLNLLDRSDEQASSGKLDMIIQLPYTIRKDAQRQAAEQRRKEIEFQLREGKYGIAYTDGTEKITQLNRAVENTLLKQIELLWDKLYAELGLTAEVMNGTADEAAMLNYNNRVIEPVLGATAEAMARSFLTKTARSQGQQIMYFRDPFKLVPMKDLAELADKFTRNEIVSSNEFRGFIGLRPSSDPKADELRNSNLTREQTVGEEAPAASAPLDDAEVDSAFSEVTAALDDVFGEIENELSVT